MTANGSAGVRATPAQAASLPRFAIVGAIDALRPASLRLLFERGASASHGLAERVAGIIADVARNGDAALLRFAREFDGVALDSLEIPMADARAALAALPSDLRDALVQARDAIATVHRAQLPVAQRVTPRPGVRITRRPDPLDRVGVYAPGGRAAYPSSVLMGVVVARVAGVSEVVVCSPPGADGRPPALVLAACALAGADRVFAVGGAGAIAAMASGTPTIPRVDRIVGPGNAYVAEAKRQLTGVVGIDCPAGPSEILIVADDSADAALVAAELMAQAEHDPLAAAVLVTTSARLLERVREQVAAALEGQPRRSIVEEALAARGALLLARDEAEAITFANGYAAEHLLLLTRDPQALAAKARGAGSVFAGVAASVAFGDYITGANHVLPTNGLARAYSGLSTADFLRWTTIQEVSAQAAAAMAAPAALLAEAEGLPGHAHAARLRARSDAIRDVPFEASSPTFRPAYAGLQTYEPGRRPCAIDLSDNTNLFGMSPAAAEVLRNAPPAAVTRYPTVQATALRSALARRFDVDPANITTACGSDDVLDSALRAFCEPADTVAYAVPTFGVVSLFARMNAARPIEVPLGADFALDPDALLRTGASVTYICRPNNPTGTLFARDSVERVVRESSGVVLIDEAYTDFAGDDLLGSVLASNRAAVVRTFSKAFGLAGLRLGYAIGPAPVIAEIEKSRGPYKVGGLAEAAALAALEHDDGWLQDRVRQTIENRVRLTDALTVLGVPPVPSSANFVLVPLPEPLPPATDLAIRLRDAGVAVRAFPALPHVGDAIRVTIGPWHMLQAFLARLEDHLVHTRAARETAS